MMRIFNYMAVALVITGITSYLTFETGLISSFYSTEGVSGLGWIVTFAPLIIVFFVMLCLSSRTSFLAQYKAANIAVLHLSVNSI